MKSRRRFWVFVAVVAGAVLVVLGRPGTDDDPPSQERPVVAVDPTTTPARPTTSTSPSPQPVAPHDVSGVVGDEALDPSAVAGALQAAEQFAEIWVTNDPQWYDRLAGLATAALAASLADAVPPSEPGHRITGEPEVYFDAPEWARIGVPTGRGTLVLDVVVVDRHWLVSAVDWRPA